MKDKTRGFTVQNDLSESIKVDTTQAHWVEVSHLPNAKTLHFDESDEQIEADRKYLQLRGAPHLQQLNLSSSLWVLHLDLSDNNELLHIRGSIEHLDFCYAGGEYIHSYSAPITQAVICPLDCVTKNRSLIELLSPDTVLIIHERQGSSAQQMAQLKLTTAAQVSLVKLSSTERVLFENCQPACVLIRDCRQLRTVAMVGNTSVGNKASCDRLRLTESGKNQLHIAGRWQQIELVSCRVERLSIDDAHTLTLRGMVRIKNTHVPDYLNIENHASHYFRTDVFPDINESTLTRLYEVISTTEGDEQYRAVGNMCMALFRCYRPSTQFHGINLLLALAKLTPAYDNNIVDVLREMAKRNNGILFSRDREVEGWLNYMQLWRRLVNRESPVIADSLTDKQTTLNNYEVDYLQSSLVFHALVETLLNNKEDKPLRTVLKKAARNGVFDGPETQSLLKKTQRRLVIRLPRLDAVVQYHGIVFLLLHYRKSDRKQMIEKLRSVAPQTTRRVALRLANKYPEKQANYLAIALSSNSTQLATKEGATE